MDRTGHRARRGLAAALAVAGLLAPGSVFAGGYDTGERDWDFLFQQDGFAAEAATRYVDPQRVLKNVVSGVGSSASVAETDSFWLERLSLATRLTASTRCLASYREPFVGIANYGTSWAGAMAAVTQDFTSRDYGLTCAVSMPLGMGQLSLLGGLSYQEVKYELTQALQGTTSTSVSDTGVGWRGGIAFEIPEYALRASLIYNAEIGYDMTGTVTTTAPAAVLPVFGRIAMPQSVELRAQSGVAPGWLAFGSVRWTDWSVIKDMPLCVVGVPGCLQVSGLTLMWKDTWTVTLGAAHQFSEKFSLAGSITWDQGATQGFTSQTDVWTASLVAILTPNKHSELKLGATAGILTSGSLSTWTLPDGSLNPLGYTASFGNDFVYSLSASALFRY